MRLIDYYNYIATAAYILLGVAALCFYFKGKKKNSPVIGGGVTVILFILIMLAASFLRLYKLDIVPLGLQQDEASIGYDAYALATYGIDRNGYNWPIYPITWGCGGGSPLLIYLNVISIKLFGTGIVKLRMIPAVCGILTVALFYFTLRLVFEGRRYKNELSLLGAAFLAISPWHVILSRWSLDSNIMPFNMMVAVYLFMLAVKKKSTLLYCFSAAAFSVCMYSYGAATIVVPIFLLLICIYCLSMKVLSFRQLLGAFATFLVIFSPLLLFYAINYLGLPEIVTDRFCFNKFTAARTGEAFISFDGNLPAKIAGNLKSMALAVSIGDEKHTLAHYLPGYASLFEFTFPVTIIGIIISLIDLFNVKRAKEGNEFLYRAGNAVFLFLTFACVVLGIITIPDTNRMVMMFIPFIFFFVKGAGFILESSRVLFAILAGILLIGALSFTKDYFRDYNEWATSIYMPGYGNAIKRAYEIAGDERMIYSTYEGLSSPFMLALYYNNYDPHKFYTTVEYKDEKAEFRIARSFGNFRFELPGNEREKADLGDVFVVATSETGLFEGDDSLHTEEYGGYMVVYR